MRITLLLVHQPSRQSIDASVRRGPAGVNTMSDTFRTAYMRARRKVGEERWPLLSDAEQERAVADEMRLLENEAPNGRANS
jgi:hypothetical protein